ELRVHHAPGRLPDVVVGEPLEQRLRPGSPDVDLPERRHVEDPRSLPNRAVLLAHTVEEGRAPPAPRPLVRPCPPTRPARLEVVHALPAVLLAEHATGLETATVERRQTSLPHRLVLVVGIPEHVVVAVGLPRPLRREGAVLVHGPETTDVHLADVV